MNISRHVFLLLIVAHCTQIHAQDRTELPEVADGFTVSVFASDPLVRNPCAMAFDVRGRLYVGQGPQYRKPKPDSPTDRITLLIDSDADGIADQASTFAEGFNSIQGLAWYGDQLWIANAPDLTVVRDTDGDGVADEYRRVFGGLGNLEHALHGLNFAPDGRLYMSKGNSKGYMSADSPERFVAPAPFADLWGVDPPVETPNGPESDVVDRDQYRHGYHTPSDDWGTEGGVLRCKPDGTQLEVFARGMRNMWDMSFDADFNWVGTDQDQDGGDRILNPFAGAHFGWGHPWSPHWTGRDHLPSTPICGPVFDGSGTGVVSCSSDQFAKKYQGAFFCADWLNRSIFVYKPQWNGAAMLNMSPPEVFAKAPRGRTMGSSQGMLFDPTDIEFGPDGALWVLSWGHGYGSTIEDGQQQDRGRVYRIAVASKSDSSTRTSLASKYDQLYSEWTLRELADDLRHNTLPARRTNAQVELVRRGNACAEFLDSELRNGKLRSDNLNQDAMTWVLWTIAQLPSDVVAADQTLTEWAADRNRRLGDRIQAIRALGYRASQFGKPLSAIVRSSLKDEEPRVRFAAIQSIHESRSKNFATDLWQLTASETDRSCFYSARIALGKLQSTDQLREMLATGSIGQRRAAVLTLLEKAALTGDEVLPLRLDQDPTIAGIASSFVEKVGTSESPVLQITTGKEISQRGMQVAIKVGKIPDGLHVRYTLDGAEPTDTTGTKYVAPFLVKKDAMVAASLFEGRQRMGPVIRKAYTVPAADAHDVDSEVFPADVVGIQVKSGDPYGVSVIRSSGKAYSNRKYSWKQLPDEIVGHTFIQPRNNDADVGSAGEEFLSFTLREPALVYVAHDRRIDEKPIWLKSFQRTDLRVGTRDTSYDLFVKEYAPGEVTLGGNTIDGSPAGRSQYVCIVKPAPLRTREAATTIQESLAKLSTADSRRGARLFFHEASCANCHKMGQRGQALAPNLTNMGTRAAPKTLAESILKPSAVIMEGFHSVSILTDSGRVHSGFIKQESGLSVELVQTDGKVITVPRDTIEERTRQQVSVMPDGLAKQLSPQQVADLIRFIVDAGENPGPLESGERHGSSRRHSETDEPAASAVPLTGTDPITFQNDGRSLRIRCGERDVATYYYKHGEIKRPFFAHVKAPCGIQVTRNFPPSQGDKKDHADMHPGIWMAFGDISGEDFWRNRGRVVHGRFIEKPSGGAGRGSFTQRKSYQRNDGSVVCHEDFRCTIRVVEAGYLIQWDATFSNSNGDEFYFGDQEEMGLGIRVATPITEVNGGKITDAAGRKRAKRIWSQSSAWCDYSGIIDGQEIGMTILCHPDNFRPSWMHARNYGLIAANPFGRKAMKKGATSKIVVKNNEALRLRYAILVHDKMEDLSGSLTEYLQLAEED